MNISNNRHSVRKALAFVKKCVGLQMLLRQTCVNEGIGNGEERQYLNKNNHCMRSI